ncbi:hypothetical protein DERP_001159 [Dermatophagoides pteronyssinus]|uniref:Uncharacterized protein n=1 Tax=Dermatophagoides pteronyssinus TaxID=6956 RepID=A0ABQ8JDP7_DERPT|nr:hypothetical protein DERP_001159 [Dermatophagoides pteronyssinus]
MFTFCGDIDSFIFLSYDNIVEYLDIYLKIKDDDHHHIFMFICLCVIPVAKILKVQDSYGE